MQLATCSSWTHGERNTTPNHGNAMHLGHLHDVIDVRASRSHLEEVAVNMWHFEVSWDPEKVLPSEAANRAIRDLHSWIADFTGDSLTATKYRFTTHGNDRQWHNGPRADTMVLPSAGNARLPSLLCLRLMIHHGDELVGAYRNRWISPVSGERLPGDVPSPRPGDYKWPAEFADWDRLCGWRNHPTYDWRLMVRGAGGLGYVPATRVELATEWSFQSRRRRRDREHIDVWEPPALDGEDREA